MLILDNISLSLLPQVIPVKYVHVLIIFTLVKTAQVDNPDNEMYFHFPQQDNHCSDLFCFGSNITKLVS